ncbi:hypothetical protein T12_10924 [Trichinella patagoniensis]|uniref:Uncharacterized protein n=1 Tax=Trichinella patagoniensis TaxID=990121 RepID=A0A0V0ZGA3_9BILA|nr:hypothetical protein T12_10924 [Trichinella patagoniensis]
MSSRKCLSSPDSFCHIFGSFVVKSNRQKICAYGVAGTTKPCLSNVGGYNAKNRKYISYPNLPSALCTWPVPHGPDVPIPSPPRIAWTQLS